MTNLLEQAISCDDGDQAAKIIQQALGIESDDVVNCTFPKTWPQDRDASVRFLSGRPGVSGDGKAAEPKPTQPQVPARAWGSFCSASAQQAERRGPEESLSSAPLLIAC